MKKDKRFVDVIVHIEKTVNEYSMQSPYWHQSSGIYVTESGRLMVRPTNGDVYKIMMIYKGILPDNPTYDERNEGYEKYSSVKGQISQLWDEFDKLIKMNRPELKEQLKQM